MTPDASLPDGLRRWVAVHLPVLSTVTDFSWPRGDSRIWRVDTGAQDAFVKLYSSQEKFTQEVNGCEHAARALATGEAPRLLASQPALPAVTFTALPGHTVRGMSLGAEQERRVHHRASRLLARWHDHPEPLPAPVRARIMASVTAQAAEAAICLE